MPALSRHLFIVFFLISIIIYSNETILDSINNAYKFDNISLFFKKEVSDTFGIILGEIIGNLVIADDSIISTINTKETSQHFKYKKSGEYTVTENSKRIINEKVTGIPPELNLVKMINPVYTMDTSNIIKWNDTILMLGNFKSLIYDTLLIYPKDNYLIDSLFIIKGKIVLMKISYSKFNKNIPMIIESFDRIKGIKEKIHNYNIIIDKF